MERATTGGSAQQQAAAAASSSMASAAFLDEAAESANRQIDTDIKSLIDSFDALIALCRIRDKDKIRIAQERFEAEARADTMVRSVQSLTLLSHSLKLSLLLAQEAIGDSAVLKGKDGFDEGEHDEGEHEEGDVEMREASEGEAQGNTASAPRETLNDEAVRLIASTLQSRQRCAELVSELMQAPS